MPIVSIIGGGPSGLAVAKALIAEGFQAQVFEPKSEFGGVWNYDGTGALYKNMNTNIQTGLMMFKDSPFPPGPTFADRKQVFDYVCDYSSRIDAAVHFNTCIVDVTKVGKTWGLCDQHGNVYQSEYVVVASGHYSDPYFPPLLGLNTSDLRVTHARYYDVPDPFKGQKVLVVGNGASAVDITIQILGVTDKVLVSRRQEGIMDKEFARQGVVFKPQISRIGDTVEFSDGTTYDADILLFCTGYLYTFPFLDSYNKNRQIKVLHPERLRLCNLYRNIFYSGDPTLAFVAMEKQIVPMPYAETQGAAIARVWAKRLSLPTQKEMLEVEANKVAKLGDGTKYHCMIEPSDIDYMASICDWVDEAGPSGFQPERWGPDKVAERLRVKDIKVKEMVARLEGVIAARRF